MMSLKTPRYDLIDFPNVYEPREDTFLFLDALEIEIDFLQHLKPSLCVEIGSGSGVIITALSEVLYGCAFVATDINEEATKATRKTADLNNTKIDCVRMNLLDNFKRNLFDVVLFNPPYVVTERDETIGCGLNRAWAGGVDGREIIDAFLGDLHSLLTNTGVCYMVLLKENKPEGILKGMSTKGFTSSIVKERKIPGEHLFVVKFARSCVM